METRTNPANHHTRFKGHSLGTRHKQLPLMLFGAVVVVPTFVIVVLHFNAFGFIRVIPSKIDWQALMNAALQAAVQTLVQTLLKS